jgi:DNA-binding MurR/RpiR family transcriptional regulator
VSTRRAQGPEAPAQTVTVANLIADKMGELRQAERKVARALIADYPTAGLGTVAQLATAAGVSPPSAVRFATALGFDGFPALQEALKAELRLRSEGPLGQIFWEPPPGSQSDLLVRRAQTMADNAVASLRKIPPEELTAAIDLLADTSRRLFLTGGRYSTILAKDLALNLENIRPKVHYIEDPFGADLSVLMSLHGRDVYVLFDFHRYQRATIELAKQIRRRRSTIILVTDERLSPVASEAQVVLPVNVTAASPFYTFSAGIMLMELLALPVLQILGEKGKKHLAEWETVRGLELLATENDALTTGPSTNGLHSAQAEQADPGGLSGVLYGEAEFEACQVAGALPVQ